MRRQMVATLVVSAAILVFACIPETEKPRVLRIGDRCRMAQECGAEGASCEARNDAVDRCWKDGCVRDSDCGPGGRCIVPRNGDGTGSCFLACRGVVDCPESSSSSQWFCESLPDGDPGEWYCKLEAKAFCGNGTRERGEECDDGNHADGDGCSAECTKEIGCGNGILEVTADASGIYRAEECDDDNIADGDGCSSDCRIEGGRSPECGNGILERGEACDPAAEAWKDGGCRQDCQREDGCGDGLVDADAGETCDDGNVVFGDGCDGNCHLEFTCGNGICEEGAGEACGLCPSDCCPNCGDGQVDEVWGETCDDGNRISGDGCSRGCQDEDGEPTCGNGIWEIGEECEDGNTDEADGCSPDCQLEFICGDGECDREHHETCQLCPRDCCPDCGDGVRELQFGEECDGSDLLGLTCEDFCYDGGTLGCTDWCSFDLSGCTGTGPVCGDGTAECDEQCDGQDLKGLDCEAVGYAPGTLGCDSSCKLDVSGCGELLWYLDEDFDGASVADWSMSGDWQVGVPSASDEPSAAHSGQNCAGTIIGGNYHDDNDWDTCAMVSPPVDLTVATAPQLTFYQFLDTETSYDGGTVWVSTDGGATWTYLDNSFVDPDYYDDSVGDYTQGQIGAYSGDHSSQGWHLVTVDLSGFAGETILVRFAFYSDGSIEHIGWYIDDVRIAEP